MAVAITSTANPVINSSSSSSTITWTGLATGAAAADRLTVFPVSHFLNTGTIAPSISATINGVAAVKYASAETLAFGGRSPLNVESWVAPNPLGTTATIVITYDISSGQTLADQAVGTVLRVVGADPVPSSSLGVFVDANKTISGSLTIPASGGAIGYVAVFDNSSTGYAWTGLTELTDVLPASSSYRASSASSTTAGAASRQAVLTTSSLPTDTYQVLTLLAFGVPAVATLGYDVIRVQPIVPKIRRSGALARGDDGTQDPFSVFRSHGWPIQSPQPPMPQTKRAGAVMIGDDGTQAPFIPPAAPFPNGWEIQPMQPGHPRPERTAAIMLGDDGTQRPFANFFPVGWEIQPPPPPHPRPERVGAIMRGDDGTAGRFNVFYPNGWAIQPPQPPHPRPERAGAVAPYLALIEPPFRNFVPLGWEQTSSMPLHIRWERSGAVMLGQQVIEARFTNFFPAGWEVQPPQPPNFPKTRLKHAGMARGDDGTQDRFNFFRPAGWEIQSPMLRHSFTAQRYTATKGSSLFAIYSTWVNSGWEIAPPFFQHPRPERSGALARGDDGNYALFQAILPPPPSGYDQPFFYPRVRIERRGAVVRDNVGFNVEAIFRRFVDFGFENQPTQPFHTRRERAGGLMRGEDGTEASFVPFILFPWGHEMPFLFPRKAFERAGAMRGDDGIEFPYIFVPPPFEQLLQGPPVYSRVRFERAAAMMPADPSTYRQFRFNPAGWEVVPPTMRQNGRPQRAGAVMIGENGTEARFRAPLTAWGYEAPFTALQVRKPLRGALMRGDDGIEAALRRLVAMGWQPSEPVLRPRKGWRGPEVFEQPVISFPNFLRPLWVDDSRVVQLKPRPRRGGALAVDTEMPQIIPFPVILRALDHWTPETFYRRRYAGAIVPWEGGWFMRRFVPVFYATSVITRYSAPTKITQASGDVEVTAAAARTVVRGEPQGR